MRHSISTNQFNQAGAINPDPRKPYREPHLVSLGDLRTLTLGGSPGKNDSGSELIMRQLGSLPQTDFMVNPDGSPSPDGGPRLP